MNFLTSEHFFCFNILNFWNNLVKDFKSEKRFSSIILISFFDIIVALVVVDTHIISRENRIKIFNVFTEVLKVL